MQERSSCSMPFCSSVLTLSNFLSLHAICKTPCVLAFVLHRCGKENQTIGSQGSIHVKECGWKCYQHLGNWFAEVVQKFQKSLPTHTDHLRYLCNGRWSRIFILSYLPVDVELQREVGHPATHWSVIGGQQYGTDCCVFTTSIFSIVWTAKCWR